MREGREVPKFIILGAGGQLGRAFEELLSARADEALFLDRAQADLAHFERLELPLSGDHCLINCAAYTQVDAAETDEEVATLVNGEAVGALAQRCAEAGAQFVHFSTDYVFDGEASEPYPIDQARAPINAYGRSKARGEEWIERLYPEALLVRTSWVYAPWGNNFVRTMARLLRDKESLRVVEDQRGRPTHVLGLAERALALVERRATGVFHVTDGGECSWFDFARAIGAAIGASCAVEPCTTAEFPRPARRPTYSVLDTSRADDVLGAPRDYQEWLSDCVRRGL